LPAYYEFGGKKEEILRQNFFRIGKEIEDLVLQFKTATTQKPANRT